MTLKDVLDKEVPKINNVDKELIISELSLLGAAEAYMDAHPDDMYNRILNSENSEDVAEIQMKKYVYGKIIEELDTNYTLLSNTKFYEQLIQQQGEHINRIYDMNPKIQQYNSWIITAWQYNQLIKETTNNIKNSEYKEIMD